MEPASINFCDVALQDLAKLLAAQGHSLPKYFTFQFDNCGENKVRMTIDLEVLYH